MFRIAGERGDKAVLVDWTGRLTPERLARVLAGINVMLGNC